MTLSEPIAAVPAARRLKVGAAGRMLSDKVFPR
jgi:hypothetical protein